MSQASPAPAPSPSPEPAPPLSPPPAEPKIPEKFIKDGKPDLHAFVNSYGELETRFNTKTEKLREEIAAEALKNRPPEATGYVIPKIEGVDEKELTSHPMVDWWRAQAFEAGLPQEKFEEGVKQYIERMAPQEIPEETLRAELGEGYKARIAAVDTWAKGVAKTEGEMQALRTIGTSPDGIKLMERLAGVGSPQTVDNPIQPQPSVNVDQLRAMQQNPKYWDPAQRDPDFIRQVEDGYAKLYPPAKG